MDMEFKFSRFWTTIRERKFMKKGFHFRFTFTTLFSLSFHFHTIFVFDFRFHFAFTTFFSLSFHFHYIFKSTFIFAEFSLKINFSLSFRFHCRFYFINCSFKSSFKSRRNLLLPEIVDHLLFIRKNLKI